jgi:hypothetical protein
MGAVFGKYYGKFLRSILPWMYHFFKRVALAKLIYVGILVCLGGFRFGGYSCTMGGVAAQVPWQCSFGL